MDRVEEIEAAVSKLQPEEYRRFADWFRDWDQDRWDAQLDRDATAGKLDFLFREAEDESAQTNVRAWPPK